MGERERQAEYRQGDSGRERETGSRQTGRWWESERQRQAEDRETAQRDRQAEKVGQRRFITVRILQMYQVHG